MLKKFWNGKPLGLMAALIALSVATFDRIRDNFSTFIWRFNVKEFGLGSTIQYGVTIRNPKGVVISRNVNIGRNVKLVSEINGSEIIIGENSQINQNTNIDFTGGLTIGNEVVISEGVVIYTPSHGYDPKSTPTLKPLIIENKAWIGAGSSILENVEKIGEGALIAAGSIVTKSVKRNSIVGGNPARYVRERI